MYGGAGGGGKSFALLMGAVQYPTSALILRRTFQQMNKSDSILDVAKSWWLGPGSKVRYSDKSKTFRFPNGGRCEFGHMQDDGDETNYQGAGYRFVAYDELTHFTEKQYTYLFSRLRKDINNPAPLRMRSATNPGGTGHAWVYKRFVDSKEDRNMCERGFVPAKLADNPNIDQASYRKSLSHLDPLTRAQIEHGNWLAIDGGRFRRDWFRYYGYDSGFYTTPLGERFRLQDVQVFGTCDPCATAHGDDFALSTWCVSPKGFLLWLWAEAVKIETPEQVERCQAAYRRWGMQFLGVEAVSTQRALGQLLRRCTDPMMVIRDLEPRGRDKLSRAVGAINLAYEGRVLLPENPGAFPLDKVWEQLLPFTGADGEADDLVDTLSYAAECAVYLTPGKSAPRAHDPNAESQKTAQVPPAAKPKSMSLIPQARRL